MNKRAIAGIAVVSIILVAFALILGTVIIWKSYGGSGGFINIFKIIIPSFGGEQPRAEEIVIIRYGILDDNVQYSEDGRNWFDFPELLVVDDKEFKGKDLRQDFEGYYYGEGRQNELPVDIKLSPKAQSEFYPKNFEIPFLNAEIERFCKEKDDIRCKLGGKSVGPYFVRVLLKNYAGEKLTDERPGTDYGDFLVSLDGKIFFRESGKSGSGRSEVTKLTDSHRTIINAVSSWRESVFEKPITISGFGDFETEKIDDYIVVNLNELFKLK
ncbi:MAG: hypothetical protein IIA87_00435 [Nanoarchaeota archaeon]|nr:hypothetical protein [Nanoarchaeota archaeon]